MSRLNDLKRTLASITGPIVTLPRAEVETLLAVVERLQKEQEEGYVFIRISDALAALEGESK